MNPSPPEQWTPKDIVLFLAVKAMGWLKAYVVERGCDEEPDNIGVRCPVYWPCGDRMPWNPLTSGDDMLSLIRAMHGKDFVITILFGFGDEPCLVTIEKWVRPGVSVHSNDTPPGRAVCTAAIKALLAKETQNG